MREQLIDLLSRYTPADKLEESHQKLTLEFLKGTVNCTQTTNLSGHATASAWVLSPDRRSTLLTHHKKLGRWLQLGGHIEDDASIQAAAKREAIEESGIDKIRLVDEMIYDIDVHFIPERKGIPGHYHYDFRFILQAENTDFCVSDESNSLSWVNLEMFNEGLADESILRMVRKTKVYTS